MRKKRRERPQPLTVENHENDVPMDADDAIRAISLLARWALRKAQTRRQGAEEEVSKVVTGALSKGSGSQEVGQLTCFGPTQS